MSIVPRRSLYDLDSVFDHGWAPLARHFQDFSSFSPKVDVREGKGLYAISIELPGVKKENVHVHLDQGILSVEAENFQESTEEEGAEVIRQERRYGKFYRSFDLGSGVQESDISAKFDDGVLYLGVPKHEQRREAAKKVKIE